MKKENKFRILLRKALYISPDWLQDAVSFFYLNYGLPLSVGSIRYLKFYNFLKESQWWPRWKLEQYQMEKLKQLLRHAYNNIPYYTDVFKKIPSYINNDFKVKLIFPCSFEVNNPYSYFPGYSRRIWNW